MHGDRARGQEGKRAEGQLAFNVAFSFLFFSFSAFFVNLITALIME
jgi:hypothetical protein